MSAVQAALGLAQLERIDGLVAKKRQIFKWYKENCSGLEGITLNYEAPGTKNTYWMVTAILETRFGIEKLRLIEIMARENIDCRPFFFPLSMITAYKNHEVAIEA
jgi:perosamine synthetase